MCSAESSGCAIDPSPQRNRPDRNGGANEISGTTRHTLTAGRADVLTAAATETPSI